MEVPRDMKEVWIGYTDRSQQEPVIVAMKIIKPRPTVLTDEIPYCKYYLNGRWLYDEEGF